MADIWGDSGGASKSSSSDVWGSTSGSAPKKPGGLLGFHLPNLGVKDTVLMLPTLGYSLARLGTSLLPGGEPAGATASAMGKGVASSFLGTLANIADVATLDQATKLTGAGRDWVGDNLGAEFRPKSLAQQYNAHGILPSVVENVGNVAIGAGTLGKLGALGDLGEAGAAGAATERAAAAGFTAEEVASAASAAEKGAAGMREAGISNPLLREAGKAVAKAGDVSGLDEAAVAARAKGLGVLHDVAHPYRALFNDVLRPLGRAATERLTTEDLGGATGAGEAAVEPAAASASAEVPTPAPAAVVSSKMSEGGPSPSEDLKAALAEAVAGTKTAPEHEASILDARRSVALEGIPASDTVKLYRGQGVSEPLAGDHWTTDLKEAQAHAAANAGSGIESHVIETTVPKALAEQARQEGIANGHFGASGTGSHLLDPYWSDLAKPVEGTTRAADPAAVVASALHVPEPAAGENANTLGLTGLNGGPVQEAITRAAHTDIANWAKTTVSNLPRPVVRALSKTDRFIAARQTGMVLRERIRMQDVNRRQINNSEAFRPLQKAGEQHLVGQHLPDGTLITPKIADDLIGDEMIARMSLVSTIEDAVARNATPTAMRDMRQVLKDIGARAEQSIPHEWLYDAEGNATELGGVFDRGIDALREAATERTDIMLKSSEKGLEHRAESMPDLSPASQRLMGSAQRDLAEVAKLEASKIPRERVMAARKMAEIQDELRKVSVELHGQHAAARAASEAFSATRIPKGASDEYLASSAPGIRKALGIEDAETPLGETRNVQSPGQRAMSTPDVGGMSENDIYRRGIEGGRSMEKIRDAAFKATDLAKRKADLARDLEDVKRSMLEHQLPSEVLRDKLAGRADRSTTKVAREMENPALGKVPAHWKAPYDALTQLHAAALDKPDLAAALHEVPDNWKTMLDLAAERGFDPMHVRSFSETEVRKLASDAVQLGKRGRDVGQTIEAGTRKTRRVAQSRTRSLAALRASYIEVTHELHTNAVAKFIDDTWARPVVDGEIPEHGVGWDKERSFLLTGERTPEGTTHVEGMGAPTKWIPRDVKKVLDAYQRDYHHGLFSSITRVTNPWRLFVLTLSPRWYVNNFVGNVVLATKEGVSVPDWVKAWGSYKRGYEDIPGAIAGGLREELGESTLIAHSKGIAGLREAKAAGGIGEAGTLLARRVSRANEVVDEMARAAVYHRGARIGFSNEEALNRVYAAMVDYNDMSPFERQIVRSVVPFYAWQKAVLKLVAKFPIDHPTVASIALALQPINADLAAQHYGGELPDYYQGMVDIPGVGSVNTHAFNPFADSASLISPQGIAGSVNPFLSIALRNALGAPEGASYQTTDPFGRRVTDSSPAQDITELLANLPQARLGQSATGTSITGQEPGGMSDAIGSFVGLRRYSDSAIDAMVARMAKARKAEDKSKSGTSPKSVWG